MFLSHAQWIFSPFDEPLLPPSPNVLYILATAASPGQTKLPVILGGVHKNDLNAAMHFFAFEPGLISGHVLPGDRS